MTVKIIAARITSPWNAFTRSIVEPNWNPKNGRIIALPPLKTSLILWSKFPSNTPSKNGINSEKICKILEVISLLPLPIQLKKMNGRRGIEKINIIGNVPLSESSPYGWIIPI